MYSFKLFYHRQIVLSPATLIAGYALFIFRLKTLDSLISAPAMGRIRTIAVNGLLWIIITACYVFNLFRLYLFFDIFHDRSPFCMCNSC